MTIPSLALGSSEHTRVFPGNANILICKEEIKRA
jgi:hypothetical protein